MLKAAEARLLLALAAAEGAKVIKTDTKPAYLYGDMGDDVVVARANSGRTRIPPTQEHLWHAAGGT